MSLCSNKIEDKETIYEVMKWGEAVLNSYKRPNAAIDAKLLMKNLLGFDEMRLLLERDQKLAAHLKESYTYVIAKRAQGIPVQYITRNQEFMGLNFYVDDRVLIPRQDTETLIELLIEKARIEQFKTGVDIGAGSGCISISLVTYIEGLNMTAIDLSEGALDVTKKNVKEHGLEEHVKFLQSDVLEAYNKEEKVDLVVSNPPYISLQDCKDLMIEVIGHEPRMALTDEGDGLSFYKRITNDAKEILKPGGIIAYEIGYDQGKAVKIMLEEAGYIEVEVYQDLAGKDRVVIGRNPV
ncbi:peptide chain release factor N(5)-glutamine methyltransferase [Cellulosilyticum ruminicola]|uniref:peptide chain release factor N(5)-glutamine methyltransferase n=1 Tax=Cellulosilyticum ruminicola TaxID=425254 RepID=UPI0006D2189B|nr:peptide chain release factor N(5)-glutamine methyltransferase [Cellulosilyticum ruminicola]